MGEVVYGYDKTIHRSHLLDVEVDRNGQVVAVWFRCMALPFEATTVDDGRAYDMEEMYRSRQPQPVEAIVFRGD